MLVFREEALSDLEQALAWYEQQRRGLGKLFAGEIDRLLKRIESEPAQFSYAVAEVRRALCRRFPYALYFIENNPNITVIAVLHQRRHPAMWINRSQSDNT